MYHATQCNATTTVTFEGDGSHPKTGEPQDSVYVEMRILENACNASGISEDLHIYYDTQAPARPTIHRTTSGVTATAERYADVEFVMYAPEATGTTSLHTYADKEGKTEV